MKYEVTLLGYLQDVRGKRLADAMEALVGTVFLLSGGASALGMGNLHGMDKLQNKESKGDDRHRVTPSWDPKAVFSAIEATSLLVERLGILPEGGYKVLQSVHFGSVAGMARDPSGQGQEVGTVSDNETQQMALLESHRL